MTLAEAPPVQASRLVALFYTIALAEGAPTEEPARLGNLLQWERDDALQLRDAVQLLTDAAGYIPALAQSTLLQAYGGTPLAAEACALAELARDSVPPGCGHPRRRRGGRGSRARAPGHHPSAASANNGGESVSGDARDEAEEGAPHSAAGSAARAVGLEDGLAATALDSDGDGDAALAAAAARAAATSSRGRAGRRGGRGRGRRQTAAPAQNGPCSAAPRADRPDAPASAAAEDRARGTQSERRVAAAEASILVGLAQLDAVSLQDVCRTRALTLQLAAQRLRGALRTALRTGLRLATSHAGPDDQLRGWKLVPAGATNVALPCRR